MEDIKSDLFKLFQNEKVVEIFRMSDGGQGMFLIEIERMFSFLEIIELNRIVFNSSYEDLVDKYKNYPNIEMFVKSFQKKISQLFYLYSNAGKVEYAVEFIKNHSNQVVAKFPSQNKNDSYRQFVLEYQKKA